MSCKDSKELNINCLNKCVDNMGDVIGKGNNIPSEIDDVSAGSGDVDEIWREIGCPNLLDLATKIARSDPDGIEDTEDLSSNTTMRGSPERKPTLKISGPEVREADSTPVQAANGRCTCEDCDRQRNEEQLKIMQALWNELRNIIRNIYQTMLTETQMTICACCQDKAATSLVRHEPIIDNDICDSPENSTCESCENSYEQHGLKSNCGCFDPSGFPHNHLRPLRNARCQDARVLYLVDKLYKRDPHQLFERLEGQIHDIAKALKFRLDSVEKEHKNQGTKNLAEIYIKLLLDYYDKMCYAAKRVGPLLMQLQRGHLARFSLTWELLNKRLYLHCVYSLLQPGIVDYVVKLKSIKADGTSSSHLWQRYINFDEEMSFIGRMWQDVGSLLEDYNLIYSQEQRESREKQNKLKDRFQELIDMRTEEMLNKAKSIKLKKDVSSINAKMAKMEISDLLSRRSFNSPNPELSSPERSDHNSDCENSDSCQCSSAFCSGASELESFPDTVKSYQRLKENLAVSKAKQEEIKTEKDSVPHLAHIVFTPHIAPQLTWKERLEWYKSITKHCCDGQDCENIPCLVANLILTDMFPDKTAKQLLECFKPPLDKLLTIEDFRVSIDSTSNNGAPFRNEVIKILSHLLVLYPNEDDEEGAEGESSSSLSKRICELLFASDGSPLATITASSTPRGDIVCLPGEVKKRPKPIINVECKSNQVNVTTSQISILDEIKVNPKVSTSSSCPCSSTTSCDKLIKDPTTKSNKIPIHSPNCTSSQHSVSRSASVGTTGSDNGTLPAFPCPRHGLRNRIHMPDVENEPVVPTNSSMKMTPQEPKPEPAKKPLHPVHNCCGGESESGHMHWTPGSHAKGCGCCYCSVYDGSPSNNSNNGNRNKYNETRDRLRGKLKKNKANARNVAAWENQEHQQLPSPPESLDNQINGGQNNRLRTVRHSGDVDFGLIERSRDSRDSSSAISFEDPADDNINKLCDWINGEKPSGKDPLKKAAKKARQKQKKQEEKKKENEKEKQVEKERKVEQQQMYVVSDPPKESPKLLLPTLKDGMVNIRMLPSAVPHVAVTAVGSSPDKNKLLYTLINGQKFVPDPEIPAVSKKNKKKKNQAKDEIETVVPLVNRENIETKSNSQTTGKKSKPLKNMQSTNTELIKPSATSKNIDKSTTSKTIQEKPAEKKLSVGKPGKNAKTEKKQSEASIKEQSMQNVEKVVITPGKTTEKATVKCQDKFSQTEDKISTIKPQVPTPAQIKKNQTTKGKQSNQKVTDKVKCTENVVPVLQPQVDITQNKPSKNNNGKKEKSSSGIVKQVPSSETLILPGKSKSSNAQDSQSKNKQTANNTKINKENNVGNGEGKSFIQNDNESNKKLNKANKKVNANSVKKVDSSEWTEVNNKPKIVSKTSILPNEQISSKTKTKKNKNKSSTVVSNTNVVDSLPSTFGKMRLNSDISFEPTQPAATFSPQKIQNAQKSDNFSDCSSSIMQQLDQGVEVDNLKLPPGISLTRVSPKETKENDSRRAQQAAAKSAVYQPIVEPSKSSIMITNPVRSSVSLPSSNPMFFSLDNNARTNTLPQPKSSLPICNTNGVIGSGKPSKKNKKKSNKSNTQTASTLNTTPAQESQPKTVTLRNPMFQSSMQNPNAGMNRPLPDYIPMPKTATISRNGDGMYTIRSPALQHALSTGANSYRSMNYKNNSTEAPPENSEYFSYFSSTPSAGSGGVIGESLYQNATANNNASLFSNVEPQESGTRFNGYNTNEFGYDSGNQTPDQGYSPIPGYHNHQNPASSVFNSNSYEQSNFNSYSSYSSQQSRTQQSDQLRFNSFSNLDTDNLHFLNTSTNSQSNFLEPRQNNYMNSSNVEGAARVGNYMPYQAGQRLNSQVTIHNVTESAFNLPRFVENGSPSVEITRMPNHSTYGQFGSVGEAATSRNRTVPNGQINRYKKETEPVENIFAPNQMVNLSELESEERDIESFKRFNYYFEPPKNKPKINLNVKDIVLKKKAGSGSDVGSTFTEFNNPQYTMNYTNN